MEIIKPKHQDRFNFQDILTSNKGIFLAGPCPRYNYDDDWRFEAINILSKLGFDGQVFNPTNDRYDVNNKEELKLQTLWEHEAMINAKVIVFWIPRSNEHPAFTTNIEFGEWLSSNKIVVGLPNDAIKNEYLKIRLEMLDIPYYTTLEETLRKAVEAIND